MASDIALRRPESGPAAGQPSMNMLAAMLSPSSAVAIRVALMKWIYSSSPTASVRVCSIEGRRKAQIGLCSTSPVGEG